MTNLDIRDPEVQRKIDSITKYPSIPTYHTIGERGILTETPGATWDRTWNETPFYVTEKVDGVNARIIMLPHTGGETARYLLGSRDVLLYAQGDIVRNPDHQIVETLDPIARNFPTNGAGLTVFYIEVFGGATNAGKNYSNDKKVTGARLIDVQIANAAELAELLAKPIEEIALWREHGGQFFITRTHANQLAGQLGILSVPVLRTVQGGDLPSSVEATHTWLNGIYGDQARTTVALGDTIPGPAEGVVVRADDRARFIAKIRFQDYNRTMLHRAAQQKVKEAAAK